MVLDLQRNDQVSVFGTYAETPMWFFDSESLLVQIGDGKRRSELRRFGLRGDVLREYVHPWGVYLCPPQGTYLNGHETVLCRVIHEGLRYSLELLDLQSATYTPVVGQELGPNSGALLRKGKSLAWCDGGNDGRVHLLEVDSRHDRIVYQSPRYKAQYIYPADQLGETVYLELEDRANRKARLFGVLSLRRGKFRPIRLFPHGCIGPPAVSRDGCLFAMSGYDLQKSDEASQVYVWDRRTGRMQRCFSNRSRDFLALAFSSDASQLAAIYQDSSHSRIHAITEHLARSVIAGVSRPPKGSNDSVFRKPRVP